MGTFIDAAATAWSHDGWFALGARRLSDQAARVCLERAGRHADELDLLVNAGLYKDHNAAEPALAAIIQEDLGANPGHPPRRDHHGTFSFDVLNGGCGVLTAAHLIDSFVRSGTAQLGMIVAGDADPKRRTSRHFPFAPTAGALLLAPRPEAGGFEAFEFRTYPEHAELFEVRLQWEPAEGGILPRRGRNVLEAYADPRFAVRCVEHAVEVATGVLDRAGLAAADVDLLIASQYPASFGPAVARVLGIPAERVPAVPETLVRAHTAGPIAALEAAMATGRFARARTSLFVTAGAGITIAVALYRAPVRPDPVRRGG